MKNKLLISVAFFSVTVGVALYLLDRTQTTEEATNPIAKQPQSTMGVNAITEKSQLAKEKTTTDKSVMPTILQYVGNVEPDFSIDGENSRVYRSYGEETLEALAEGGDLLAIKELAHRIIRTPITEKELQNLSLEEETKFWQNRQRAEKNYLELAIVYGDTELLDYAVSMYGDDFDTRDPKRVRSSLLEKLAFTEFAAMRGAQAFKFVNAPILIKVYKEELNGPAILTEKNIAFIRQRAKAIYDNYEHRREELGLGPFEDKSDNDPNIIGYDPLQIYLDAMGENAF